MNVLSLHVKMAERVRMESTATRVLVQQVTVDATVKQVSNPTFLYCFSTFISIREPFTIRNQQKLKV